MGILSFIRRRKKQPPPGPGLKEIFQGFQQVLAANNESLALMGQLEEKLAGGPDCDLQFLQSRLESLDQHLEDLVATSVTSGGVWMSAYMRCTESRGR